MKSHYRPNELEYLQVRDKIRIYKIFLIISHSQFFDLRNLRKFKTHFQKKIFIIHDDNSYTDYTKLVLIVILENSNKCLVSLRI